MTEAEWLACDDPERILSFLQINDAGDRLLRLLACAGCRAVWQWLNDERSREAVEVAEKYADGQTTPEELRAAASRAHDAVVSFRDTTANDFDVSSRAFYATQEPINAARVVLTRCQTRARCKLVREIFGNPFRPVVFSPEWRTDTAVTLARQMYDSREFSAMPILADALQDAGCDEPALLKHLRSTKQTHVRGCWALDLVLGKE